MTSDGTNPPQTPAGWYPDTTAPGTQRYWDGSAWTQHTAPLAGATPVAAAPVPAQPHPAAATPQPAEPLAYPAVGSLNAAVPVNAPEKKSKAGLIIGLIVGGIALLVVLAIVALFATRGDSDPGGSPTSDAVTSQTPETTPTADTSEAPADAAAVDLVIGETAWGVDSSDLTWFAVIVTNPNADYVFDFAEVTVEAVDADGTILDSSSSYPTLLPGDTGIAGTFFDVGNKKIDHLEVRGPTAADATFSAAAETGTLVVSDVESKADDWSTTVSGNVASTFAEDQDLVDVVVFARSDGKIVASTFAFIDRLPAGGKARFEASFFQTFPKGTTFEVFPSL